MMTILAPITFSFPTLVSDDGSLTAKVGKTGGIDVDVCRFVEVGEQPLTVMVLYIWHPIDAMDIQEFDRAGIEKLRAGGFPAPSLLDDALTAMDEFERIDPSVKFTP
ncbi:hypothetical protein ACIGKR_12365 [Rhodococcus qingshengii]|uniref:hypothetical protein n=1 Tax=Rhodococcus qingshengii TaxID=334542 RepID=UPI0037C62602